MKKRLLSLMLLIATLPMFAQNGGDGFQPKWSLQLQGGLGHTLGETEFKDLLSPAAALSVEYQFSPMFGARANFSGLSAKGANIIKSPGIEVYSFDYIQGAADLMFHINGLYTKDVYSKLFDPYIFAGIGCNYAYNNDEAVAINNRTNTLGYIWDDSQSLLAGHFGVGTGIRLSNCLALSVEVNTSMLSDKFNSKVGPSSDWQSQALIGLTFKFGKKSEPASIPAKKITPATPAKKEVVESKPKTVTRPQPAVQPKKEVVKAVTPVKKEIFYALDSYKISSTEQSKIANIVTFMKQNPETKLTVTGYADKNTGTSSYNRTLSKKRADSVADAITAKGIDASRITVLSKGSDEQPFTENNKNRTVICIAK